MKALVLKQYNQLQLEDVPVPEIGPEDVLVRVKACGICGSDVHGLDGSTGRRQPPIVMGHEASGVIAKVGSAVAGWKQGEPVTFDSTVYCGECDFCKAGQINLCDNRQVLGVSCDDYRRQGAFAEYVSVPQHILYRLPDNVGFEQAAMAEPVSIALHAVRRVELTGNQTAVVVGSGMIGLFVLQWLKLSGCKQVVAVDVDQRRLGLARELGADVVLNAEGCDVRDEVLRRTGGRGAHVVFEVVGTNEAVRTAIGLVRKGGSLILVGNVAAEVEFPLQSVVTRQISLYGSCASCGQYAESLNAIATGRINVDALISATAPLSEGADWFRRLYAGDEGLMKVILVP